MSAELLINVCEFETRVAVVADGLLQEVHLSRDGSSSLSGNVYLGRVEKVIPGMQAAFVAIGLERPGFLHVRDIAVRRPPGSDGGAKTPDIRSLVKAGDEVLVQITKDPISTKGARLTTDLAIASRFTVLMPFSDHIGISQRIEEEPERERLRALIDAHRAEGQGFIARTAAEGADDAALARDMRFLNRLWDRLLERRAESEIESCVYEELPLHIRMVRDVVTPDVKAIVIDDDATYERVQGFVSRFLPEFESVLQRHEARTPILARYGVEDEINRALDSQVGLKCGGSIVIEQTEAMTTVDVNTGAFLGGTNLEETVYRANLEAASLIPRQLRLRNLGGIVVIDFIDMADEEHQRQVLRVLEKGFEADPARIRLEGFSSLGLVQLSRKRTMDSLQRLLCEPCERCDGTGLVKSAGTTSLEVLRALACEREKSGAGHEIVVRSHEAVVDRLLDEDASYLERIAGQLGCSVRLQVEPCCGPGEFELMLMQPNAE